MEIQLTVSIPDELLVRDGEKVSRRVFEQFILESYKNGKLTTRQVRELLGFSSRFETEDFLHRNKAFDYTIEDLEKDLMTLEDMESK